MLAIDTNVIVRYVIDDDPRQSARAREAVRGNQVWVSTTVLLEAGWVLRGAFGYSRADIAFAIREFAGLPTVMLENTGLVAAALELCERGVDFADALHLAAAGACDGFLTFDQRLIRSAAAGDLVVREP